MSKHISAPTYIYTWIGLLALTTGTFFASRAPVGGWDLVIALGFATTKGLLVALIFMHLLEQRFTNRLVLLAGLVFVVLLITGVVADVATRPQGFGRPPRDAVLPAPAGLGVPLSP